MENSNYFEKEIRKKETKTTESTSCYYQNNSN